MLIKCPECATEASARARDCPKCGHPLQIATKGKNNLPVVFLVVGILFFVWRSFFSGSDSSTIDANRDNPPLFSVGDVLHGRRTDITIAAVSTRERVGSLFYSQRAAEGAVFIVVIWKYKNISNAPLNILEHPSIELMDQNGTRYKMDVSGSSALATEENSTEKVLSDLNPGITVTAASAFEVSKKEFDPDTWHLVVSEDQDFVVKINREKQPVGGSATTGHHVSGAEANEQRSGTVSKSAWTYEESIDPITKKNIETAKANLTVGEHNEALLAVSWSCPEKTTESTTVEISTFLDKGNHGKWVPLAHDESHSGEYQFDGIKSSSFTANPYLNTVIISPADLDKRGAYIQKNLVTLNRRINDEEVSKAIKFNIVDSAFSVKILTVEGNITLNFSLEEPAIKKLLMQCGFTYLTSPPPAALGELSDGRVPIPNTAKNRDANRTAKKDVRGTNTESRISKTENAFTAGTPTATLVKIDPKHPFKISEDYYPELSKRDHEEGRCVVRLTVTADGSIENEAIQTSTGFARLDDACLKAVHGQRMIPATENGVPIEKTVLIPITWNLTNH